MPASHLRVFAEAVSKNRIKFGFRLLRELDEILALLVGRDRLEGIATGYGLDGPGIGSRWGIDFPHFVQTDPGTNTASCTMGNASFPGIKCGRGVLLTTHQLLVPW